ncbi:YbaB/EbfC family nucleoid-associated protein [Nocardia sp. NPDC059180]|uniref:YbaB/EbfC family nucleoid-associated protein n=1 Tax=Nocardia sp. NPDC059180 TaxID=3346761 RepID=UPI003698E864
MESVDALTYAMSERRSTATSVGGAITVSVTADGSIHSIQLSEAGHRLPADQVADLIKQLHATALAEAQQVVAETMSALGDELPSADVPPAPTSPPLPTEVASTRSPSWFAGPVTGAAPAMRPPQLSTVDSVADDEDDYYRTLTVTQEDDYLR